MAIGTHPLQCRCGSLKGALAERRRSNRVICYCRDCQAFAHYLGNANAVLDERGGSDIVQVQPGYLVFTQGVDQLACLRLTPKGLLRWYARCCRTPIGNTLATPKIAFIGLLHACLGAHAASLDEAFGPVTAWVNVKGARGDPKPRQAGVGKCVWWFVRTAAQARISGEYRRTPLFRPDTGAPVVAPHVLSPEELARVMRAVQGA